MAFLAGQTLTGNDLNLATRRLLARGVRTTPTSGATTTEIGIMRFDDIPAIGGRIHRIWTNSVGLQLSAGTNTLGRLNIRYTTDGSTPTNASTQLTLAQVTVPSTAAAEYLTCDAIYVPAVDEVLSIFLGLSRPSGTGTVIATASTGTPGAIELYVEDLGVDIGNSAVIL